MVKLVEVVQHHKSELSLREIYVNPSHVVFLREDVSMRIKLQEQSFKFPKNLDTRQVFTRIQIHNGTTGTEFIVVGTPNMVEQKLNAGKKELLHG